MKGLGASFICVKITTKHRVVNFTAICMVGLEGGRGKEVSLEQGPYLGCILSADCAQKFIS